MINYPLSFSCFAFLSFSSALTFATIRKLPDGRQEERRKKVYTSSLCNKCSVSRPVEGRIINYTVIVDNFPQISIPFVFCSAPMLLDARPHQQQEHEESQVEVEKEIMEKKTREEKTFILFFVYFLIIDSLFKILYS